MTTDECYRLGQITKPFGLKGEVIFFLDVDDPMRYAGLESVFVKLKGQLIPYFIKNISINGNKATVSFDDLPPEESLKLVGNDLYLPLQMLPKLTGNQFYFHEVKGFAAVDSEKGHIGIINDIIEYPAQPIFQILNGDTEILIPLVDPVIKKVDRKEKVIYIEAPNGLIDLYMNINNSDKGEKQAAS
ncbi:MAG: 16S rRNA processing protein RimM [Bacteroidales bacterium]|nr:16S rRNA processing protein RimM [Bacteroidales bacterium]